MSAAAGSKTSLSKAAFDLLRELAATAHVVGYDHRIKELDEAKPRLIQWIHGEGYLASDAGLALLVETENGRSDDDDVAIGADDPVERYPDGEISA